MSANAGVRFDAVREPLRLALDAAARADAGLPPRAVALEEVTARRARKAEAVARSRYAELTPRLPFRCGWCGRPGRCRAHDDLDALLAAADAASRGS